MPSLRSSLALAAAIAVAATAAVAANTPTGAPNPGLIWHSADKCYDSQGKKMRDTDMIISGGSTFWMGGIHYAVKTVTYSGAFTGTYDYGVKSGLSGAIQCYGQFDDPSGTLYVHSTDVPIQ